jgi:hypothetical protein
MSRWLVGAAVLAGCAVIKVGRDLSMVPVQQVVYDDMCGLQQYFDEIAGGTIKPPRVVRTTEFEKTEGKRAGGGKTTFAFETHDQIATLRRVLQQNWKKVPPELLAADRVEIEVHWAERASVRRAVTDDVASISDGKESWDMKYQVCLSELLFGAPLYATRRDMLGLPPIASLPDAGAPDTRPAAAAAAPTPAP